MIRSLQRRAAAIATTLLLASLGAFAADTVEVTDTPLPPKPYTIPAKAKDFIRKAIENPARTAEMKTRDGYRMPAEVLQMSNVKPGSRVVEFSAYGNYYSSILSDIVGEKGELWMYDAPFASEVFGKQQQAFVAAHPNTHYSGIDWNKIELPKQVDVVTCFMCFHEILLTGTELTAFHSKLFKAMKPGAIYIVVFADARSGTGTDTTGKTHRIEDSVVRSNIQAGGFELMEEKPGSGEPLRFADLGGVHRQPVGPGGPHDLQVPQTLKAASRMKKGRLACRPFSFCTRIRGRIRRSPHPAIAQPGHARQRRPCHCHPSAPTPPRRRRAAPAGRPAPADSSHRPLSQVW